MEESRIEPPCSNLPGLVADATAVVAQLDTYVASLMGTRPPIDAIVALAEETDEGGASYETMFSRCTSPLRPLPLGFSDAASWRERFDRKRVAVVEANSPEAAMGLASELAFGGGFECVRCCDDIDSVRLNYPEIIMWLGRGDRPECLILQCFTSAFGRQIINSFDRLEHAISASRNSFGLLILVSPQDLRGVDRFGWPVNILRLSFIDESTPAQVQAEEDADYDRIFDAGDPYSEAALSSPPTDIERALVQIACLFGDLPSVDFERLLAPLLEPLTLEISRPARVTKDGQEQRETEKRRADQLWARSRKHFLRRSGLISVSSRIAFASPVLATKAASLAWENPGEMQVVFQKAGVPQVLFFDEVASELWTACAQAAMQLARRDPRYFGAHWLHDLLDGYARWVAVQVRIEKRDGDDLFAFLHRVAAEAVKQRGLWRHFGRRVGRVCFFLLEDDSTARLAEEFFERLAAQGLHDPLWEVVKETRNSARGALFRWAKRLLCEGDDDIRGEVRRWLAREGSRSKEQCQQIAAGVHEWLPEGDAAAVNDAQWAALGFPAVLLDAVEWRVARTLPALDAAALWSESGCIEQWRSWLLHPDFSNSALRDVFSADVMPAMEPAEREALPIAMTLFKLQTLAQEPSKKAAEAFIVGLQRRLPLPRRLAICAWWNRFGDDFAVAQDQAKGDQERFDELEHRRATARRLPTLL